MLDPAARPPVVELVLGVQFSPLPKLTTGHFGRFWQSLGEDWSDFSDAPSLDDQFETFESPRSMTLPGIGMRIGPMKSPGRALIGHKAGDRLIQIQSSRFHFNWRRKDNFYPRYRTLVGEFESHLERFERFADNTGVGGMSANQWEMTYIDAFYEGEDWASPADWCDILPGLFGTPRAAEGLRLEDRAAHWTYEIESKRGRLHIVANAGRALGESKNALILQMTARGPVGKGGVDSLRLGLDLGHAFTGETFRKVISDTIAQRLDHHV